MNKSIGYGWYTPNDTQLRYNLSTRSYYNRDAARSIYICLKEEKKERKKKEERLERKNNAA